MNDEIEGEDIVKIGPRDTFIPGDLIRYEQLQGLLTFWIAEQPVTLVKKVPGGYLVPRETFTEDQLEKLFPNNIQDFYNFTWSVPDSEWDHNIIMQYKKGIKLRDNQKKAWASLQTAENGILNLACGKGKTFLALNHVMACRVNTLVIAPQIAHLKNWEVELNNFFKFVGSIGWIKGKTKEAGNIIFATVQTLANKPTEMREFLESCNIGLTIFDECHCMSATHFSKAANLTGGQRIGLTATPNRRDRNEGIFSSHVGKVFFSDTSQELVPTIRVEETGIVATESDRKNFKAINGEINIPKIRSWLANHEERNDLIIRLIQKALKRGRTVYVLAHTVKHLEYMHSEFKGSTIIHGATPAEERLPRLNSGNPVFATIQIGREGLNRKDLDTLFMLTPFSADSHSAITLEQSVGRILREHPNKKNPEVFIFKDPIRELNGMFYSVLRQCKKLGYKIKDPAKKSRRRFE